MNQLIGDILNVSKGIVCQQVNCQSVMGAGLGGQIKRKWPIVYKEYRQFSPKLLPEQKLGQCQIVRIPFHKKLFVVNLFGQLNFGRKDQTYTDYEALNQAISRLKIWMTKSHNVLPVYFPYKIGCGLAGGDWKIVYKIIEKYFPDSNIVSLEKDIK